ncbi:MAG: hypothetical protein IPQ25_17005 [Chitinophagaceae bacterium]|nr:hypothetical protein [Chitinophagaceae bacterium]
MSLTPDQITTLRADILADPALVQYAADARPNMIVAAYNSAAVPAFRVWRSDVKPNEIATVFVWTEIDALAAGKARIWEWMRLALVLNCGIANIRKGLNDAFSAATATKAAVLAVIKRDATRAEELFATGTGSDGSPGTMTFVGNVTDMDVELALKG